MRASPVVSTYEELGQVDPSFFTPLQGDFRADIGYLSHDKYGSMSYPDTEQYFDIGTAPDEQAGSVVVNLRNLAQKMDGMVRDYRGYTPDQVTRVLATYRVGLGRRTGTFGPIITNALREIKSPIGFIPPGNTHFDRSGKPDYNYQKDTVILSNGGRPTIIYEGPTYDFSIGTSTPDRPAAATVFNFYIPHRLSRLFVRNAVMLPQNVAVLINGNTLHQQAGQLFRTNNPPAFLRTEIMTVSESEYQEQFAPSVSEVS